MARTTAWRSAALAALAAGLFACREQITATGHCPELCPTDSLVVLDTILTGVVSSDTSLRGFTRVDLTEILVASNTDSLTAWPLIRFTALPQQWFTAAGDTVNLGMIDSVIFQMQVQLRDTTVHNQRLLLYHLPVTIDTNTTYDSVVAAFTFAPFDSLVFDSVARSGVVRQKINVAAATPILSDSFELGVGIAVRGDTKSVVRLLSSDLTGSPPQITYFVHGAAPRDTATNAFTIVPSFDTWVQSPPPPTPATGQLVIGGQPAARSFVRFAIPSYFVDSVTVIRATLLLSPLVAPEGIRPETTIIAAQPVLRDFGGKSILIQDTAALGLGRMIAGDTTDVSVEISKIFRLWKGISPDSLPRMITLRNIAEDLTTAQVQATGAAAGAGAPRLRVSYVRPFRFGVP